MLKNSADTQKSDRSFSSNTRVLNPNSVDESKTYLDANGRIFRKVESAIAQFISDNKSLFLVKEISDGEVVSEVAQFHNGPSCWSSAQIQDYSSFAQELYKSLLSHGMYLWDGHPYNFMFQGSSLKFIDIGSLKIGTDEHKFFMRELQTYTALKEFYRTSHVSRLRERISTGETIDMDSILRLGFSSLADNDCYTPMTERFNRFRNGAAYQPQGRWVGYRSSQDYVTEAGKDTRTATLLNILRRYKVSSAVDVGCNDGLHAITCAKNGCQVLALDIEDYSISELFKLSKAENLNITAAVATPDSYRRHLAIADQIFWPKSDLVLLFAIVHHLIHDFNYSFDRVFEEVEIFSPRIVALEFVSYEDIFLKNRTDKKPTYSIETACDTAKRRGYNVEVLPPHEVGRQFIIAVRP